jgi:L-arabinose isomerase
MENKNVCKIGLLPLYLRLYDDIMPEVREEQEQYLEEIYTQFITKKIEVIKAKICRISDEFAQTISDFEREKVDCIVTLHLAYSPSLECIDALSTTKLPIVVLDTTRDKNFNSYSLLMYNHGIHGVQDMCNMLLRKGKQFFIEAGHFELSNVIERTISHIKGIKIANHFKNSRIGQIGKSFEGMGDFEIDPAILQSFFGISIIQVTAEKIARYMPDKNDSQITDIIRKDQLSYDVSCLSESAHISSVRIGVALKKWLELNSLDGFTINFNEITKDSGMPMMPFFEICKLMTAFGYAGEGDVLTTTLMGAIQKVLGNCSFTEMFCPDWETNTIFLSHMGEINFEVVEEKIVLFENEWPYTDVDSAVFPSACFKNGEAILVNLAPQQDNKFALIVSAIEIVQELYRETFGRGVRGWMKTSIPIADFLRNYSELGGTHHSVLVYGREMQALKTFGSVMGWEVIEIK